MMIPEYSDLETWAASLIIDFPTDNIPLLTSTDKWKEWGNSLSQCTSFIQNSSPTTQTYNDWKSWASGVFSCMNNY